MSPEPNAHLSALRDRAQMLKKARSFFDQRNVLELDCPILNATSNIDDCIDPISVRFCQTKTGYLHTSPELFMKKLISQGIGDCYFMGHVFRDHEKGEHHHVEFTMVEWYRHHLSYEGLIAETIDFVNLFVEAENVTTFTYFDALKKFTGIDYTQATKEQLQRYIDKTLKISLDYEKETFTDLLIVIFTEKVEPEFEHYELVVLKDYPKEQSALAKIYTVNGVDVSKRFEIYYKGVELANGYDELVGDQELLERYVQLNKKRQSLQKQELPIDQDFIAANKDLPQCTGVAVGFDRLMMIRHQHKSIHKTMALIQN